MEANDVTVSELLSAFEILDGTYKRDQVNAALELREKTTPHFIDALEIILADPVMYIEDEEYFAHVYAVILLGYFRESRAHRTIIDLFSLPPDMPEQLFGDITTENLPSILFRTCGGSIELIKSLALNQDSDVDCRASALRAMVYAAVDDVAPREEVMDFFGSLFSGSEADPASNFWNLLAGCINDLYPRELMNVIEQAYAGELISPGSIGRSNFKNTLRAGKARARRRVRAEMARRAPDNIHDWMSWWACFQQGQSSSRGAATSLATSRRRPTNRRKARQKRKSAKASRRKTRRR